MKKLIKKIPIIREIATWVYVKFVVPSKKFSGSTEYWKNRYQKGGNSGDGSYDRLAEFKAEVINDFIRKHDIQTVIELGCGDGNQLLLAQYPKYLGFDVSDDAIKTCINKFHNDPSKAFLNMSQLSTQKADLSMSLDVIYHLVEDEVFDSYMRQLFDCSNQYVIIYSSDRNQQDKLQAPHVKHRKFTQWVEQYASSWILTDMIPNKYPYNGDTEVSSFADFYFFKKAS